MSRVDTQRNQTIMRLAVRYSNIEIATAMGISRERVRQIIRDNGGYPPGAEPYMSSAMRVVRDSGLLGTMSDAEVAQLMGVSYWQVYVLRRKLGIGRYEKPIGCGECEAKTYARGLCRACYDRRARKRKKEMRR
uniref:Putative DNA binding, helix-turn-helix domain containing protein n=2 Tax=viral metagenome TaxID=1070528 RepID=A0A6M3IP39_9ZZZZ